MSEPLSLDNARAWRILISSAAIQSVAYLSLWLLPSVVNELTHELGLSIKQAGSIATAETLTVSAVLLLAVRWRRSVAYGPTTAIGLALTVGAAIACMYARSFEAFMTLRILAALGFGLLMLVPSMALASFRRPDLMFGRLYAVSLLCSAFLLYILPSIGAWVGRSPAFPGFLAFVAVMMPFIVLMPRDAGSPPRTIMQRKRGALDVKARAIIWLAAGAAAIGLSFGQVWAFFMVFGQQAGLTVAGASMASSLSLVGALVGSLLAGSRSRIINSLVTFRATLIASGASLILMMVAPLPGLFVAAGIVAMFGMYFFFPTLLGAAAKCDDSGRGIALINGSLSLLSAIGPLVAGVLLDTVGKPAVMAVIVVATTAAILLFELVWREGARTGAATTFAAEPVSMMH